MNAPELVFVYGTLRRGYVNHSLLGGASALGPARTREAYALYLDDFPYLVESEPVCAISGELYAVSASGLGLLDQLEEHPSWYERRLRPVVDQEGQTRQAWIYFFPQARGRLLASGDLAEARDYTGGQAG
ncbi:MAG: gamma-glutamylcyclotransferase [Desulfarculus sp.]|nr:gamma-glutamylcyclotransferase [Desulfarculus sp.]